MAGPTTIANDVDKVIDRAKKGAKKPKQGYLKGMKPKTIPELNKAATKYVEVRDARVALTKEEVDHRDKLAELMKKHGLKFYDYDGQIVTVEETEKIKVKRKDDLGDGYKSEDE